MRFGVVYFLLLLAATTLAQEQKPKQYYSFDANTFFGSIWLHNPDISHLIKDHPAGFMLAYNRKTFGAEPWQQAYNYPDLGASFIYQNSNNGTLGDNFGLYAHFNFYFLKRNLQFRIGQGVSYATNPYDKNDNFRNNAYGSRILSSTFLMLNYHRENIFRNFGLKAGLSVVHYSNANVRAPNTSTNTIGLNIGVTYNLFKEQPDFIRQELPKVAEPFRYNLVFRTGINMSDNIGSGQFPFYVFSGYIDKRLSRKSGIQLGADLFLSNFLKELIRFQSVSFPENNIDPDTDYKRVGVFAGYELFINKLSIEAQLGYYAYYPFDSEGRLYNRLTIKRYFGKKLFGVISLKSHAAAAESVGFGIGVRL